MPFASQQKTISLEGKSYPIILQGDGRIPCLCIGLGSLMQRTLSENFKKIFTVYSSDLYFTEEYKLLNPETLTIKKMAEDIISVCVQLKLEKPIILGNSCFGILALEVAKYYSTQLRGIILVAAAQPWNDSSINTTHLYFRKHAEPERIANDSQRKQAYELIRKPNDSEACIEKYISDSARYWGNFNIGEDEIRKLWEGIIADDAIMNHFFGKLLPQHSLALFIEAITIPVILLAGECDYDSIPLVQWKNYPHPLHFTVINCGRVGHWPHLEDAKVFDQAVCNWLEKYTQNN